VEDCKYVVLLIMCIWQKLFLRFKLTAKIQEAFSTYLTTPLRDLYRKKE